MSVIYIAGPMSGYPDWNYPAFHIAAAEWRNLGWFVQNPAENFNGRTDLEYQEYIREAIPQVMSSDALALLPQWYNSTGALTEAHIAIVLGIPLYYHPTKERFNIDLKDIAYNMLRIHYGWTDEAFVNFHAFEPAGVANANRS